MRCPRCAIDLLEAKSTGAVLNGCQQCGGIWLDFAVSARLRARCAKLEALAGSLEASAHVVVDTTPDGLPCPV